MSVRGEAGLSQIGLADRLKTARAEVVGLEKGRGLLSYRALQKTKATGCDLVISIVRKS